MWMLLMVISMWLLFRLWMLRFLLLFWLVEVFVVVKCGVVVCMLMLILLDSRFFRLCVLCCLSWVWFFIVIVLGMVLMVCLVCVVEMVSLLIWWGFLVEVVDDCGVGVLDGEVWVKVSGNVNERVSVMGVWCRSMVMRFLL